MHIWTAISFEDQLAELRNQCISVSEELALPNPSLTLPIHTSLAISFEVAETQSGQIIADLTDYFSSLTPFPVRTKQVEQNGSIIWLKMEESPELTGIHAHLIGLLQRRYGVEPHPFDLDFQFHATLFFGGRDPALDAALARMQNFPLPEVLTACKFVIGTSPSGEAGTYSVCREIYVSEQGTSPIRTPRLRLKPMTDADADPVIDLLTNQEVTQTFMVPDFPSRQDALPLFERLKQLSMAEDRFVYGIYLEDSLIGFINDVDRCGDEIELGYVIHPHHKNQGFAAEALSASIQALWNRGFSSVKAGAFEENHASIRVMEKCGMTLLTQTEDIEYRGRTHRCVFYQARRS